MLRLKRVFSLAACRRTPGSYFYEPGKVQLRGSWDRPRRFVAALLAGLLAGGWPSPAPAGWDSSKPAQGSALVSAEIRDNWAALAASLFSYNVIRTGDVLDWSAGASAAPDGWVFSGAGGTIARAGTGEGDTFNFGAGRYSVKMTRAGANLKLTYTILSTTEMSDWTIVKGQRFAAIARGKTSTASHLYLTIDDGVGTTSSSAHTGGGAAEYLRVARTIDAAATKLEVYAEVRTTDAAAYVGAFAGLFTDVDPTRWSPFNESVRYMAGGASGHAVATSGRIAECTKHAAVGNVGTGEDDLMTCSVRGDTLKYDGQTLQFTVGGQCADNVNTKTLRIYWGGTNVCATNAFDNVTCSLGWHAVVTITRTGAATQEVLCELQSSGATSNGLRTKWTAGTATLANANVFKVTGDATSNNDLTQELQLAVLQGVGP